MKDKCFWNPNLMSLEQIGLSCKEMKFMSSKIKEIQNTNSCIVSRVHIWNRVEKM